MFGLAAAECGVETAPHERLGPDVATPPARRVEEDADGGGPGRLFGRGSCGLSTFEVRAMGLGVSVTITALGERSCGTFAERGSTRLIGAEPVVVRFSAADAGSGGSGLVPQPDTFMLMAS